MPFNFTRFYSINETNDFNALLIEIKTARSSIENHESIETELKTAIQEYFVPNQGSSTNEDIFNRLRSWSVRFQQSMQSTDKLEISESVNYLYKLVCEVLLQKHDIILDQFTNPEEISKTLGDLLFLRISQIDMSILYDAAAIDPSLMLSPVICSIFINRFDEYNATGNSGLMNFLYDMKQLFKEMTPDLANNQNALMAWTCFWMSQAIDEDREFLQKFMQKYYHGSFEELLEKSIAFANNNNITIFELLGRICSIEFLTTEEINTIKRSMNKYMQDPINSEKLVSFYTNEFWANGIIEEPTLELIAYLPAKYLANEIIFQAICDMIAQNLRAEHESISHVSLLHRIVAAMSDPNFNHLMREELDFEEIDNIIATISVLLVEVANYNPTYSTIVLQALYKYLSIRNHGQMILNFCIKAFQEKLNVDENHLRPLRLLPPTLKNDPRLISLLFDILQRTRLTRGNINAIDTLLLDHFRWLSPRALAQLLTANKNNLSIIGITLNLLGNLLSTPIIHESIKSAVLDKILSPEVTPIMEELKENNRYLLQNINKKYASLKLVKIMHKFKELFFVHQNALYIAQTPEQRKLLNNQFIENINELNEFSGDTHPNLLEDLVKYNSLLMINVAFSKIHKAYQISKESKQTAALTLTEFINNFMSLVSNAAVEEDLDEEDDDPNAGLPYKSLNDSEKIKMRSLLENQLKAHVAKFGGIDNQSYLSSMLIKLPHIPDPAKYLRPLLSKNMKPGRIDERTTNNKIRNLLNIEFPITQVLPKTPLTSGNGNKKLRI